MDVETIKTLTECLRQLPWWGGCFLVLMIALYWLDKRLERKHKDSRADKYVAVVGSLSESIKQHETKEHERGTRIESAVIEVQVGLKRVCAELNILSQKTRGAMSPSASIRLIQLHYTTVTSTIQRVVEQQLWDHLQAEVTDLVSRRVRTLMAATISQVRGYLRAVRTFSVPVDYFFPIYQEPVDEEKEQLGGERFRLVDILWRGIAPLFRSSSCNRDKLDAMNLIVDNLVTDFLSGLVLRYQEDHPGDFSTDPEKSPSDSTGVFTSR